MSVRSEIVRQRGMASVRFWIIGKDNLQSAKEDSSEENPYQKAGDGTPLSGSVSGCSKLL